MDLEVRSNFPWPSCGLSNFAKYPFTMDGEFFAGMEGFLQGCKVRNIEHQRKIFMLTGIEAMTAGRSFASKKDKGTLFFKGVPFSRYSERWQTLMRTAYFQCAIQNREFRIALRASKGKTLKHTMAKDYTKDETIITVDEFLGFLNEMRDLL